MRIGLVSFEYPPDTANGGIATYVRQAARMLAERGHSVEVFCAANNSGRVEETANLTVNRIDARHQKPFLDSLGQVFSERHRAGRFDVVEGPDFGADARAAIAAAPEVPLVVKLHTPTFLVNRLNMQGLGRLKNLRFHLSNLKRGRWSLSRYSPDRDPECSHAQDADEIAAPSSAVGDVLSREWKLDRGRVRKVPYPFVPDPALLSIPPLKGARRVVFLGRLEARKGVLPLARAIPLVLRKIPDACFTFVGRSMDSPDPRFTMVDYLRARLGACGSSVQFCDAVQADRVPEVLAQSDVCIFPSRWESFGLVCAEAMAAARAVVASSSGGMAELLGGGAHGELVPPDDPRGISEGIIRMLADPQRARTMGLSARQSVLEEFGPQAIGRLQEESYGRAIIRRRELGPRKAVVGW